MEARINEYVKKMEELKAYGEWLLSTASENDWDEYDEQLNEVDNMDMHFECSLKYFQ